MLFRMIRGREVRGMGEQGKGEDGGSGLIVYVIIFKINILYNFEKLHVSAQ